MTGVVAAFWKDLSMGFSGGRTWGALAVAVTLAVSGCSTTVPGEAVPGEVVLDTGNFATVPRDVPQRVGDDAAVQGNIALADYVVPPSDVDPALDWGRYTLFPNLPDGNSMFRLMGTGLGTALQPGRVSGVLAPVTEDPNSDGAPQATWIVLRYSFEFYAKAAFEAVAKLSPTVAVSGPAKYPEAYVGPQPESFRAGPAIWLRHKEYILAATFANIEGRDRVEALATAYFDRQLPKLDTVPFAPADAQKQPADKDGILRLTRVDSTEAGAVNYTSGYYSAHSFQLGSTGRWSTKRSTLAVHGIDLIGYEGRNQVLRAASPARAADYVRQSGIGTSDNAARGFRLESGVPGLGDSVCHSTVANLYGRAERVYSCTVSRGRYVAAAQGASLLQAQQGGAASYMVLKNAE
ncbi:DUF7373 family lipoprotein [Tsukamurella tyrosinosolvens]|uniref:DUF7373 family lipoprotein n=1 Tax=Tsukamurella tyrosinosolvens TaxID=57704 RepID=UPI000C7ED154|nr:hypothetical protein [Tsukamurella tyrosinosolvens]AUN38906.1 hypothetical protein ASU32_01835 [Tsukamurella tyrosinosolvens]